MQHEDQQINEEVKEEIKPISEEADFSKPDYIFIPKGNHIWRQEGYYLLCSSCDLVHATYIGKDKIMVGMDEENNPILKKRKELGLA